MVRPVPGVLFPIAALLLLAGIAGPILTVLATVPPADVASAFASSGIRQALRVSFLASTGATVLGTVLGVPAGYYLARVPTRISAPILFVLALPLAFPPVASGIMLLAVFGERTPFGGWLSAHGLGVVDSLLGVAAAEFFVSGAFVAIAAAAAFRSQNPIYEDAARTLGVSERRIFFGIALPGAANTVAAGIAFAWLRAVGEYGATSIVAYHPTSLPIALYVALSASGVHEALALCYGFIMLAAIVVALQWVLRRRVVL